jgi:polyphosphate kinase
VINLIRREADNAQAGKPARIVAKLNSLVDREAIEALYKASAAGVKIDLIIRGICCLRPGVPELSENITVRSIIGRFLEHGRVYYFENGGDPKIYMGSADWMPRNFFRRIETAAPVTDPAVRDRLLNQILSLQLADNVKAWLLGPDGAYTRVTRRDGKGRNSQAEFMALAVGESGTRKKRQPSKQRFPTVQVAPPPA